MAGKLVVLLGQCLSTPRSLSFPSKIALASTHGGLRANLIGQNKLHGKSGVSMGGDCFREACFTRGRN